MQPDRNIISPLKLKDEEVGTSSDQFLSYEFKFQCDSEIKCYREEQYDVSEARCWTGESSAEEDIAKKDMVDMCYDVEEKYREIGTEREVENDGMQATTSNQLFSKVSSTNMLDFVTESELIPAETLYGETATSSQTCNLQHNNPGEFPTELEMQSEEGVCSDQVLDEVINDRSEFLDIESEVIEEENNDIKEEINAGSTKDFTKEDFIRVNDEKDGMSTFMNERETASVITNIQDYAFTDQASMVVEEHSIGSPDKGSGSPVHAYPTSDPMEIIPETQVKLDMQVYNAIGLPDQKQNMSEECLVNPTNTESEAEQFESTSRIVYIQDSRQGQDDAVAENVRFSPSEKKQIDSTQRSLSGLISGGDQKDSFKTMKETMQVQSSEESTPMSEDGTLSLSPETCYPQSSESLNIMEPEAEKMDENVIKAVVKNENTYTSQEYNETRQHISTEVVNTNQECSVLDRQGEETVVVKNICRGLDTTHVVLSDVVDTEVLNMQSITEVVESTARNEEAVWEGDKDGQRISLENLHQNTYPDLKLGLSKSSECTEFVTDTINTDHLITSAEPMDAAEIAQLSEENILQATTTAFHEEACMLISKDSHRRKMGSIHRTLGGKREEKDIDEDMYGEEKYMAFTDISTCSQQYMYSELSSQIFLSSQTTIEHSSAATEHGDFKEDDRNSVETVEKTNAEIHTQTQTKKKKKFGSTRRPHGRHQPHAEGEEGEWKDPETTEEIEHQIITQAATSNLLTEPQNTMSEVTLDIHDSPMTTEQKEIIKAEVEIVTEGIDASLAILSHEVDQIHTVVSDEVSNAEGLTDIIEQHERSGVNEENVAESTLLYEQEMEPVITKIQDDAFTEHVSLTVKKHGNGSPDNEHVASEVNVYNTCGPVELIPETQAMSDMQMNTEHIHAVVSDQNQNISEEHLENPTNRESEAEQLESTSPFVQIQESKSSQLDVTKETLEFSSSEKRRKIGSTRKSLRGQIPRGDQENKLEAIKDKENIQEQNMDQEGTNTGEIEEENDDTKEEINAGITENLIKEDITTVCAQQNVLCELSSQTTDLGLSALEHPSPATEHPDFKQDDGNITENVEKTNAEIHTQTQTKKKKKFGSTRRPHGRHQPHAEGEEGEWKDPENTEEIEHQIITQAATSNLLTEPQNTMSEVTLDIHDSPMTTEQKEIIKAEVEIVTEGIDASPAILSHEVDQIHTVVSDEVSNAEGLTDIIEQHERSGVNEENVAESTLLYEQEMEPVITKIQDDAFTEHVSLTVKKHGNGSPDNEHVASEVNVYNTCGPVELIPETQAMSDMQMNTEHIHAAVSDQNQNISEEHLENPTNRESEAEQLESTSPFVQIQESKSSQLDVTKETLEFSSSEKRRKIGSTRKSLRGQIPRGDQENKLEAIKDKENIQEQNMDQEGTNTGEIEEENDDAKEEINAGTTENLIKEDITTVSAEQNVLCELSSQTTDLGLSAIEHPSPATEHPDFKQDDGNITENVENRNAEIHTQTQTKKKKKFGSTRRPHGRHQPHAEGEEGEWKDPENTEEIEHQIITQAATSNLLTEPQNTMSEVTLDIHDSPMTTEQKEIIKAEVEIVTEGIDASPAILSHEVDQIHTVVSDEVSNAEGLTDIIEQHERSGVNEENVAESKLLYEQEMEPVITKIQDDAFTEHVSLTVKKHGNGSPDNEHVASEVNVYNTCGPVELIPETQAMSDMQMNTEHIHAVVSDQNQNISEEHLENPTNRESEAEQLESTSPFVQIQESKSSQLDVTKETLEFSSSEKRRKIGSTRKSLRGQIPRGDQENKLEAIKDKENIQEQNMDQEGTNTGEIEEENDDTKEEINAGTTEILIKEDITTVSAEQNVLCELSSQTTDLGLSALEHPSPATEHPDFKQDDGNITENVEKTNAEIHTQTQTKKKKKFGSTRRPHGRHQPHAEGEEGEWKDPETTEKIEHQIITQAATSNLLTEPQNTMSEVTLDIHDSPMTTEQKEIIKAEVEIMTEGIDASPAILSHEVDQIHTVVSDEVSNAEGLTDIIEQHERSGVNEKNDIESTLLYEQEMEPVITKIQDEAFTEHVSNLSQSMSQTKKKKKFGSTRRPHGRHQPHAEGEEGEWKDPENTEQTEHQIITQAATSNLLTEPQNTMSEVTLDIHDSPMTTEQKEIIKAEVEIVTEGIDASLAILSHEVDQIHTVVSDEVSNAEGLTDIIEQHERSGVNEENVAESTLLYEQEMEPVITKIQDDAFTEHVSLAIKKHGNGSPDNEHVASEVNVYNTCGPVELIPETQAMSDMQMNTEHIHAVVSDQNQNISEEHLENPTNRESEAEQLESTSPFVQIQESKSSQLDVTKETLEFSSSEKRRKIGSTRKSLRGQIPRGDQENKLEAIKDKENIQEQNMDQEGTNTGEIEEENDDTKEEINAGTTEILIKEDITTVSAEQNVLCELSSQTTDLGLSALEHPSPATEHPDFKQDDGNITENVEKTNAEIHTQTQTKKKKKFGSTRRPHGRHQPHAEGEEGEWKDPETTEKIEHQIITQAATSNLLTEPQNTMSEVTLDIHDSPMTTEQKEIIKAEVEIMTEGIDASPAILSHEVDQIHTVVSDEVSNAEGLTDIIEQHERSGVNEKNDIESTLLYEQEMEPVITKIQDEAFTEHVSNLSQSMSQTKKKKKFGSTRRPHGRHQPHAEGEEGEWKDPENTEQTEHQIITQAATSNLLTEPQNTMSEVTLDIHDSPMTTEQKEIIKAEVEIVTEGIDASLAILSHEVDQIHTVVSDEVSNAEGLTDIIEQHERSGVNEENVAESTLLYEQEMEPVITKIQDDAFTEHVSNMSQNMSQTKKKKKFGSTRRFHGRHQPHAVGEEGEWKDVEDTEEIQIVGQAASSNLLTELQDAISELSLDILEPSLRNEQGIECTENESANQPAYPTHGPIELIPETHARLDMPVVSEQYHMMSEEHLENPKNRDSKPEQCESTCSVVHIQELKLAPDEMATQNSGHSGNSGRRKKIASTRRSLRVIKEKENIQEQTTEEITSTSEKDHAQERTFNLTTEISHQSIQTHSEPLNIIDPEAEKMSSTCKNLEEGQSKQEALQKTKDMNPRYAGDIDREHLKLVAIEDSVNPDSIFGDTKTRVPEYEPQIHNNLDQSEGSLLSEIEFYLNKSFECTLNTTALNPNISEFSEPMSEVSLQLPSSQNPQIHMEPSSPARRRKMGSSRKTSRNKHAEKISNESGGSEQEKENLDKNNAKNSEPKREAKTVKETVMAAGTEDMKESVELMSEVQALSRINESSTQETGQLLPEGRRKFGSRRTAKGRSGLGAFTHDDYESNQKKTDDQVTKDDSRVSDPYFISEPETTPISHPVSEPRPEIEEVRKTVVKDTNASTKAGVVVNTGGRQKIDFDQWNEQLPDFGLAIYNVVMVGNSNVGKTSFIKRLQSGQFTPDYGATIGVDTFIQTVTFGSRTVKLYVWDTAGQERYHSITRQVFHKAQGLLLMYDITSSQSFHAVRAWISQVQEKAPSDVILMLLGNKNDCAHREVQLQEGEDLSKEYNIHFMECSAATGDNVSESLKTLAWLLVKQRVRKDEQHTTLQPKPQNKKSGCC
ncbi:uncharacterized protein rab44 [Pangasianodon hypophthalmus]|uniref:uncharacterized protein rab44 n=1 Tax=Pangasianodon hypophthalmus TaxID=310915 RepID=UPI002307DF7E|nr:uncharacterized protein rab44 [Pangasianodon hypophthalmus]